MTVSSDLEWWGTGREQPDGRRGGQPLLPPEDIRDGYFEPSDSHTTCPRKGEASYRSVVVNGERNEDAPGITR